VAASGLAVIFGVVVGLVSGYLGGLVDGVLGRLMDVVLAMPFLLFALALVSLVGSGLMVTVLVIACFSWASVGRVVRGETLSVREREFVTAARSVGAGNRRLMFVEVFPNVAGPVLVYATLLIPTAIIFEATLSFLGLGIVPPTPAWGSMLSEAVEYYQVAWWLLVFPGLALLGTAVAFNLLGDSLRDAVDVMS
jgi:ABC-type dipeptide/oligopeptide/nickel transport system permease subunit